MTSMTSKQAVAFANPCREAWQTTDHRFISMTGIGRKTASVILTMNVGLE